MDTDLPPTPERPLAYFRFYEELNDFLAPALRKRDIEYRCARAATVKNAIEALGVPHTEVEVILVNGESVDFSYLVRDADRISVYPKFESFDIRALLRVREAPLRELRFVADAHLGGLARLLRMLGFDTVYSNTIADDEIRDLALTQQRIVLSRDRELLKRREITHGCFVRALKPSLQLREIVQRLQLEAHVCAGSHPDGTGSLPSFPRKGGAEGDGVVCAGSHHPAPSGGTPPQAGSHHPAPSWGTPPQAGGEEGHRVEGVQPFSRCLHCNTLLTPVSKEEVLSRLPEKVALHYQTFSLCTACKRIFWEGSHWHRMRAMLSDQLRRPAQ